MFQRHKKMRRLEETDRLHTLTHTNDTYCKCILALYGAWTFFAFSSPEFFVPRFRVSLIGSLAFSIPAFSVVSRILVFGLDNTATHSFVLRMRGRVLTSDWKGLRTPSRCLKSMSLYKIIYYQTDKFRY